MPLAFESLGHGTVAFGFFNIETDLLLLEESFFFATDFCRAVEELCESEDDLPRVTLAGWHIEDPARRGDLHGAIAGIRLEGLIGETYRRWPFPRTRAGFRQQPECARHRDEVEEMLGRWAVPDAILLGVTDPRPVFTIGAVEFDATGFAALVAYVERGGMPRWRDETRPAWVQGMTDALSGTRCQPLAGIARRSKDL